MSLDSAQNQRATASDGASMTQVMGRHWVIAAGHPLAAQAGARVLARGRQCHRRGCRRGHDPRRRPSGHGQLRGGGAHSGAPRQDRRDLRGLRRGSVSAEARRRTSTGRAAAVRSRPACSAPSCPPRPMPGAPRSSAGARCRSRSRGARARVRGAGVPALRLLGVDDARQCGALPALPDVGRAVPEGRPGARPPGDRIVQAELAQTIKLMVEAEKKARARGRAGAIRAARDVFYKGEIARRIAEYHAREGGLLDPRRPRRVLRRRRPRAPRRPSATTRSRRAASGARGRCCCRC